MQHLTKTLTRKAVVLKREKSLKQVAETTQIYYIYFLTSSIIACTIDNRKVQQSGVITALWLAPLIVHLAPCFRESMTQRMGV